jgi:Holliday junction resolvasome RuvABC ATP-dependent DNA helicase subunit
MAIKDTSKDIHKRLIEPVTTTDDSGEESLRPKKLSEYIGQTMIKKHLQVALD